MGKTLSVTKKGTYRITLAAVLTAIGILIPMISPIKIVIGPASFTLASHVSIFLAMFISPMVTAMVCVGTTLGFLLGGFPIPIVLRAASHIVFALVGTLWLKYKPKTLQKFISAQVFSFVVGVIHAIGEVLVVSYFYFGNKLGENYYQNGFFVSVILLVGVGGLLHSIIDFNLAYYIYKGLCRNSQFKKLFYQATE